MERVSFMGHGEEMSFLALVNVETSTVLENGLSSSDGVTDCDSGSKQRERRKSLTGKKAGLEIEHDILHGFRYSDSNIDFEDAANLFIIRLIHF